MTLNSMSLEPKSTLEVPGHLEGTFLIHASPPSCHQYLAPVYFSQGAFPEAPQVDTHVTLSAEEVAEGFVSGHKAFT